MKKLLLILLCLPMIGFGQIQYRLDSTDYGFYMMKYYYDALHRNDSAVGYMGTMYHTNLSGDTILITDGIFQGYVYNSLNGSITKNSYGYMNSLTQTFDTTQINILTYNSNNQLIYATSPETNFTQLYNSQMVGIGQLGVGADTRTYFSYNTSNEVILSETYKWDGTSFSIPLSKTEQVWQSGLNILRVNYNYDINNASWDTNSVTHNTYSSGNLIMEVTEGFNNTTAYIDTAFLLYNNILNSSTALPYSLLANNSQNQLIAVADANGVNVVNHYYSNLTGTTLLNISNNQSKLLNIVDMLGRETKEKTNQPLFYIYDDGTVEKRIVIE